MKTASYLTCTLCLAMGSTSVHAFDINTHTAMTSAAIEQSASITATPNTSDVIKRLGLFDRPFALGSSYIDIGSLIRRSSTNFEGKVINSVGDNDATGLTLPAADSIPGWLLRGAIREDDNTTETPLGTLSARV